MLSILKNIGGSEYPIQDYLKQKITENVGKLSNMFDNENLFSNFDTLVSIFCAKNKTLVWKKKIGIIKIN